MCPELDESSTGGRPEPGPERDQDRSALFGNADLSLLESLKPNLRPKRRQDAPPRADTSRIDGALGTSEPGTVAEEDQPEGRTFAELGEDLERRSRHSAALARLLEQHRQQLDSAEAERDAAYERLARVVPIVQETAAELRDTMASRKLDDDPAQLHRLFVLNGRALDELEKVAVALFADFLWVKSCWEQYGRAVADARRLHPDFDR